jgi:trans-aconitate 2-methyltransferase
MSDWDAARYHRVSDPQLEWGRAVVDRLAPQARERILDVGCGTGRLTAEIAACTAFVVGLDRSSSMLAEARNARGGAGRPRYLRGDGASLPFSNAFDAVFSAATFHWIPDHNRLFLSIHTALKAGGRLVAQCGGGPNLDRLYGRARRLMASARYAAAFAGWTDPWHFEPVADTEARLARAGFSSIDVSLVPAPTTFDDPSRFAEFVGCVCLRHHVERLDERGGAAFVTELTEQASHDQPPYSLDYWRLNLRAIKAPA